MLTALTGAAVVPSEAVAHVAHAGWGPGPWWFVFPLLWFLLFASVMAWLAIGLIFYFAYGKSHSKLNKAA